MHEGQPLLFLHSVCDTSNVFNVTNRQHLNFELFQPILRHFLQETSNWEIYVALATRSANSPYLKIRTYADQCSGLSRGTT